MGKGGDVNWFVWTLPGRESCDQAAHRRCIQRTRCRWSWCSASRLRGSRGRGSTGSPPPGSLAGWGPPPQPWNRKQQLFADYYFLIIIIFPFQHKYKSETTPPSRPPAKEVWATGNVWKPYNEHWQQFTQWVEGSMLKIIQLWIPPITLPISLICLVSH